MSLPAHIFVDNPAAWRQCVQALRGSNRIGIDLESNSMYAYRERVCLIQASVPGQDYIVDPLADLDLAPLGDILADPAIEKIFHAAEYDLILVTREFGWRLENLFDTMWAARVLGYKQVGLANILGEKLGVKLNKRFQRSNWCRRPLSTEQLSYAQNDTHFLLTLRDMLAGELKQMGRWEEALEIFAEQSSLEVADYVFDPEGFWSLNGVNKLPPASRAVVRELYIFRDREASRCDKPPFKIFGNNTILGVARAMPRSLNDLVGLPGMSPGQIQRYGRHIVNAVRDNFNAPSPKRPKRGRRPSDAVYNLYEKLHGWRKRRARQRGVESDVIVSRDTLWQIAHARPQTGADLAAINGLGPHRLALYADEILAIVRQAE